jgi:beta-fructofuranosidase
VDSGKGLRILGFADGGKAHFGGYVMDPEPVTVSPDGLLHVTPQAQAAE